MERTAFQLRVCFSNYETGYLIQHLNSYLEKLKRHHPSMDVNAPSLPNMINLLQFESSPETKIQAL